VQELARDNPRFDGIREVFSSIREPTERAGLFEVLRQQDLLRIPEGGVQPLGSWDDMRRQLTTLGIAAVASPPAFGRVYPGFIANARLGYDFQDRADVETELPQVERTAVMLLSSVTPENYWALRETVRCSPTTSMDVILELRQLALDIESMCADSAQGLPEGQARTERARQGNDIHEAIHNHPSPRNLDLINGFLDEPWLTPDMRQTALRTREILEDIYHVGSASSDKVDRRFAELNVEGVQDEGLRERLNRFRDVAADDVRAARELGGVRLAVRDGILSPDTAPEERLHLMQIDLFLEELGYGLYSSAHERLEEGPASMPERLRLMDSIIQSQVANGMCNPGMTALGRQLTELADKPEWEREDYMRAFGVMAHLSRETDGMITQLHHSFDPILPEVASQRRMEPKNPHIIGFVDNIMRAQPLHMLMEVYIPPVRDMVTGELGELSRAVDPTLQRQVSTLLSERPPEEVEQNIFFFAPGRVEGSGEMSHVLGGKGAKLAEMAALGLPVPPGFTVRAGVEDVEGIRDEVVAAVRELEEVTGRTFGGRENPLLVSVRSGARLSMPGMMDTVLNLGLNDDVVAGLSDRHGEEFAYDCYERFLRMYGRTVLGIRDERFERREKDASGGDFKRLAAAHKKTIADTGLSVPEDPIEQLMGAVGGVQRSWESPRARQYRALHGIPNEWGTAVNVQQMVFGNLGENSGTGVVFSRDKETGENVTRINYLENAQGEDVVAGVRTPLTSIPDERIQREVEETTRRLEQHFKDMVDVELTVQEGKLFILQVRSGKRSHEARARIAVEQALSGLITPEEALERVNLDILDRELTSAAMEPMARSAVTPIATAPNLSFGAAAGVIALSPDKARELHQQGTPVILVRRNTSPEDFEGMLYAQGVLTAEGGANSHAAITCNGLNKPCLPGCPGVQVDEARGIVRIGGVELREGIDALTFDGETGEIFRGALPLIQGESNPYLETLRDWEREVNA
jgi:phosphohistidine swiveling domain-containing protein